jgi:hypothetical protein
MHRLRFYLPMVLFSLLLASCSFQLPGLGSSQATQPSAADQIKQIVDATLAALTFCRLYFSSPNISVAPTLVIITM